jgi:hypothetical protein
MGVRWIPDTGAATLPPGEVRARQHWRDLPDIRVPWRQVVVRWFLNSQGARMHIRLKTLLSLNLLAMLAVIAVVAGPPAYAKGKALITGADVQDSSLTGADVLDGSLGAADLDASALPAAVETYTVHETVTIPALSNNSGSADCTDRNDVVLGGGYSPIIATDLRIIEANVRAGFDEIHDAYVVSATNPSDSATELQIDAVCLAVPNP